jgi:glycosyltransferase involved in cell wall biosynthesis
VLERGRLHIAYAIDHVGSGGAQRQVVELARHLATVDGLRVSVLVHRDRDFFGDRLREVGVPLVHIEKSGPDPRHPLRVARWLSSNSVDVLHAFLLGPVLWMWLATRWLSKETRPRLIAAERNSRIASSWLEHRLQQLCYRRSDAVTANSAVAAQQIVERLGVPADRVHFAPNGIDLEAWDREAAGPSPLDLAPGAFHLGLVGRLEPQKNHRSLLRALARVDAARRARWRVWFVGAETGSPRFLAELKAEMARLGVAEQVRIVPPQRRIAAFLRRLSVVVLPSSYEGFPNVVLEAMAAGVPVVATPVGESASLVADGKTGFLVDVDDTEGLARALVRVDELSALERESMGREARARVASSYAIDVVARRYLEIYRRVARTTAPGAP